MNNKVTKVAKKFVAYFYFVGWQNLNLGISIDIQSPNLEIHVPFGFIRIGYVILKKFSNNWDRNPIGYEGKYKELK